jgi:hypothetical protein
MMLHACEHCEQAHGCIAKYNGLTGHICDAEVAHRHELQISKCVVGKHLPGALQPLYH